MRTKVLAVAAGLLLAVTALSAQNPPAARGKSATVRRPSVNPFGPQPGVKGVRNPTDLKTVLYYAADALGMLRGGNEVDLVLTMELFAAGTMNVGGEPCKLTNYRASIRYRPSQGNQNERLPVPAMREDFTCAGPGGKPGSRRIQVVAGKFAWNEGQVGMKATPAPDGAVTERLLRLWTLTPESAIKAAMAAGAKTTLTTEGGLPVLTFPLPAPFESATMKATLDPKIFRIDTNPAGVKREFSHLIDRTETRIGNRVIDTSFSTYGDWNEEDLSSMILLPRRIAQKQDGVTVIDLTLLKTDTYNPYVIMPVPEAIGKAGG